MFFYVGAEMLCTCTLRPLVLLRRSPPSGRGGSVAAAVAAAALGADTVEIYTDVDGVFTDPQDGARCDEAGDPIRRNAGPQPGAQASSCHGRSSSDAATRYRSTSGRRSTTAKGPGCASRRWSRRSWWIARRPVRGEGHGEPRPRPGVAAALFGSLATAGVNIDMIVQNVCAPTAAPISASPFPRTNLVDAERIAKRVAAGDENRVEDVDAEIAKVSLVGAGMEYTSRCRRQGVRNPGFGWHQHRNDLPLHHPHLLRGQGR